MEKEVKLEKWYESKITFLIAIITPMVIVMAFIFSIKTDVAVIQNNISNINTNHETHIQDIMEELKDINNDQKNQNDQIIELQKQILLLNNKR